MARLLPARALMRWYFSAITPSCLITFQAASIKLPRRLLLPTPVPSDVPQADLIATGVLRWCQTNTNVSRQLLGAGEACHILQLQEHFHTSMAVMAPTPGTVRNKRKRS